MKLPLTKQVQRHACTISCPCGLSALAVSTLREMKRPSHRVKRHLQPTACLHIGTDRQNNGCGSANVLIQHNHLAKQSIST